MINCLIKPIKTGQTPTPGESKISLIFDIIKCSVDSQYSCSRKPDWHEQRILSESIYFVTYLPVSSVPLNYYYEF